jgi:DNA end-binding protein Ku
MPAVWKGSISFGLVNIPVALQSASRTEELTFRLLRGSDLSPVNYKRVAQVDGKEVPWNQIVKGYEYEKGKYVVLKDEDFRRVDLEATGDRQSDYSDAAAPRGRESERRPAGARAHAFRT